MTRKVTDIKVQTRNNEILITKYAIVLQQRVYLIHPFLQLNTRKNLYRLKIRRMRKQSGRRRNEMQPKCGNLLHVECETLNAA